MEGTELLVQAINLAIAGPSKVIRFAPTMVGCYDVQLGVLAYVNAGGQTAAIRDSDGTRLLPDVAMPLGLFTHLIYDASMQAFEPGAELLIVTKGVTQSMRGNVPFGPERVMEVLRGAKVESAEQLCREVLEAADRFKQGRWQRLSLLAEEGNGRYDRAGHGSIPLDRQILLLPHALLHQPFRVLMRLPRKLHRALRRLMRRHMIVLVMRSSSSLMRMRRLQMALRRRRVMSSRHIVDPHFQRYRPKMPPASTRALIDLCAK